MQGCIQCLYDRPLTLTTTHGLVTISPSNEIGHEWVQYCPRIPSDSEASVHYEVYAELDDAGNDTGYRIVLHVEEEASDGNAEARRALVRSLKSEFRSMNLARTRFAVRGWSQREILYAKQPIAAGLSQEEFICQVSSHLSELYEIAECVLIRAERDPRFNPYGYDEEKSEPDVRDVDKPLPDDLTPLEQKCDAELWEDQTQSTVISVARLLKMKLRLPDYQRPYKWERRNVVELLCDVENALEAVSSGTGARQYRLGTIILHEDNGVYNVVDGQQRLLTLSLLMFYLKGGSGTIGVPLVEDGETLKHISRHKESGRRLHDNYEVIKEYIGNRAKLRKEFYLALFRLLQVVVVRVSREDEAFQLFDSQNTRGRALDPHDLLKAYHLRAMQMDGATERQMNRRVIGWESVQPKIIRSLFDSYLFRIYNWSRCRKTHVFTAQDIAAFKGLSRDRRGHLFPFVRRAVAAGHEFQIGADFQAGEGFFALVEHYLDLRDDLRAMLDGQTRVDADLTKTLRAVTRVKHTPGVSSGFRYIHELFDCALYCYADRFGLENVDSRILAKLCRWAYSVMLDRDRMSEKTVNRYAVGLDGYTNGIPMFSVIQKALHPSEVIGISVGVQQKTHPLHRRLKKLEAFS